MGQIRQITESTAVYHAKDMGATDWQIQSDALRYAPQVGSSQFNNMIKALCLHSWNNSADEWLRLAAALRARRMQRARMSHVKRESVI